MPVSLTYQLSGKTESMTFLARLKRLFTPPSGARGVDELARRMETSSEKLRVAPVSYREFRIPKRGGGQRLICAPEPELKALQKKILRRVLGNLPAHVAATGFEKGSSIVHNAACHIGAAVVVRLDVKDFFPSTQGKRVRDYFYRLGWNREASELLTRLCTHGDALPAGAPTSPRLSNLVNYRLDLRLTALADRKGAIYTRYADDLTFSLANDRNGVARQLVHQTKRIAREFGYAIHERRKLRIRRHHQQQLVTGLVVNEKVNVSRSRRRWLRAVEHRIRTGRRASLTPEQLSGWQALLEMIETQRPAT